MILEQYYNPHGLEVVRQQIEQRIAGKEAQPRIRDATIEEVRIGNPVFLDLSSIGGKSRLRTLPQAGNSFLPLVIRSGPHSK